jgi:hypothetical protein
MIANGAIPSLFFALTMVSSGLGAVAGGSATRPSPQAGSLSKGAHLAKAASSADPFEEPSTPTKPGAPPALAAPSKPGVTPAAPPAQNFPPKELEAFMKSLEGSWKCDTKFPAGSMGPGSQPLSAKTDITIKKEFGGFAWHGEFKLAKTASTSATSGVFQISYAAGAKQATFLSYDSVGSAMMGAGALVGDAVTFAEEGFLKGVKVRVRETLAAKGPRKLYHKVEIEQGNGYRTMAEDTCSK